MLGPDPSTLTLSPHLIFAIAATQPEPGARLRRLVSFGHALYLGIGAYASASWSFHGVDNGWLHWPLAIAAGGARRR
jgi:branched-chain amino acid transport system permease protein